MRGWGGSAWASRGAWSPCPLACSSLCPTAMKDSDLGRHSTHSMNEGEGCLVLRCGAVRGLIPSGWAWCVCRPGRGGRGDRRGGLVSSCRPSPSPASGTHRQAKGVGVVRVFKCCPLRRRCELSPRQKGAAGVCRHPRDICRGKQRSPIGFKRRKRAPSRDPKPAQASGHGPWGGPRRSSRGQGPALSRTRLDGEFDWGGTPSKA